MAGIPAASAETASDALSERRWADAIRLSDIALTIKPNDIAARTARGFARGRLKDYAGSLQDFTVVLAKSPDDALVWHGAGKTLRFMGSLADGFAVNERALELAPETPDYLIERGVNLFLTKNYVPSSATFERVNELMPSYPGINAYRAELYLYLKDGAKAELSAAEGLRREPSFGIHHINLAHAALFSGNMAKAKELYLASADMLDMDGVTTGRMLVPLDFKRMRESGIVMPGMDEVEQLLKK